METTYFNARSKSKEAKLLSYESLEKIAKSNSLEEVTKTLLDLKLIKGEQIESYEDLTQISKREEREFLEFLKQESIHKDVTKFFLLKYDYFNLECLYFYLILKKEENPLMPEGNIKISTMRKCLETQRYEGLSPEMQNLLTSLDNSKETSTFIVDNAFKQAMNKEKLRLSKVSKDLFECQNYLTDLKNIELALRLRDEKMFSLVRLEGGKLDDNFFKTLCVNDLSSILESTKYSTYRNVVEIIVEAIRENKPFQKFDFLMDCFPITFFDDKKYDVGNMLPYIRYCYLEITQIKNLKIIFDGLIGNQNKKKLCSSLRRVYEK